MPKKRNKQESLIEELPKAPADPGKLICQINSLALKIASAFVPKADSRPYLLGINIRPLSGYGYDGVLVTAMDGKKIVVIRDAEGWTDKELIVKPSKEGLSHASANVTFNVMSSGSSSYMDEDLEPVYIQPRNCLLEGDYPRYENVISLTGHYREGISGAINPSHLRSVLKIDVGGYVRFYSRHNDAHSPLVFKFADVAGLEIIGAMQKEQDSFDLLPEWFPIADFELSAETV